MLFQLTSLYNSLPVVESQPEGVCVCMYVCESKASVGRVYPSQCHLGSIFQTQRVIRQDRNWRCAARDLGQHDRPIKKQDRKVDRCVSVRQDSEDVWTPGTAGLWSGSDGHGLASPGTRPLPPLTSPNLTGGTLQTDANTTAVCKICSQLSNQEMESSPWRTLTKKDPWEMRQRWGNGERSCTETCTTADLTLFLSQEVYI